VIKTLRRILLIPLIAAIVAVIVLGLRGGGLLMRLELMTLDAMIQPLGTDDQYASDFLLVTLDETDVAEMAGYPVPDKTLATVLKKLLRPGAEPAAIGLDIYRDKPVPPSADQTPPPGRAMLDRVLVDPRIVVTWRFADRRLGVAPPQSLRDKPGQLGFANEIADPDGVIRRVLLTVKASWAPDEPPRQYASLDFLLAMRYLKQVDAEVPIGPLGPDDQQMFGPTVLWKVQPNWGGYISRDAGPTRATNHEQAFDARGYQYMLDMRGPSDFPTVHFRDVLNDKLSDDDVAGRVVLIGVSDPTMQDYHPTPRDPATLGVALQAMQTVQLIRAAMGRAVPLRPASVWAERWMILGACAIGATIGVLIGSPLAAGLILLTGAAILAGTGMAMLSAGFWLPVLPMALGWIVTLGGGNLVTHHRERANRKMIMRLFRAHVDPDLAEYIWSHRDQVLQDGRLRSVTMTATILFVDLVGYSRQAGSARDQPDHVFDWLNQFHEALVREVKRHHGTVYQFLGDQIVALFGPPVPADSSKQQLDAHRGARCALSMRQAMQRLNQARTRAGLQPLSIRVGLYTGVLVAGSIGDQLRQSYAVVGDSVNIAARLESYDKQSHFTDDLAPHGCRILLGDTTAACLDEAYDLHPLGPVELRNITKHVEAYALRGGPTEPLELQGDTR